MKRPSAINMWDGTDVSVTISPHISRPVCLTIRGKGKIITVMLSPEDAGILSAAVLSASQLTREAREKAEAAS